MNLEKIFIFMGKFAVFVLSLPEKNSTVECCVHNNKVYNFN